MICDDLNARMGFHTVKSLNCRSLRPIKRKFRQDDLNHKRSMYTSVLLMHCRLTIFLDPILWLPMSRSERNRYIRWCLGWPLVVTTKPVLAIPKQSLTKGHPIHCLQMHRRPMTSETISDLLSFLLNMLSIKRPHSFRSRSLSLSHGSSVSHLSILSFMNLTIAITTSIPHYLSPHLGQRLLEGPLLFPLIGVSYTCSDIILSTTFLLVFPKGFLVYQFFFDLPRVEIKNSLIY